MKANGELTGREAIIMTLATGMMYGGATFVLVFDNPAIGIALTTLNFFFWVWVAGFFVAFGKDGVFGSLGTKKRAYIAATGFMYFLSKRYRKWVMDELKALENSSCTFKGEGI